MHDGAQTLKGQYMQEWADSVNAASNGGLNISVYPGGALAGQDTVVEAMQTGACQIAMVYVPTYDALFPLTNAIGLPMIGINDTETATKVLWDLYENNADMAAEFDDYVLIHMYGNACGYLMMANTPVSTFDQMNGLKIRSAGGSTTDWLVACGAAPLTIGAPEVYESLEKGLIDGNIGSGSQVKSWNLGEVDHYFVDMPIYSGVWLTLMNKDSFNSLSAEMQDVIMQFAGEEYSITLGNYLQDEGDEAYAAAVDAGTSEWVSVSDEERAKFYDAAMGYNNQWIENHTTDSFDAQAYYDLVIETAANVK